MDELEVLLKSFCQVEVGVQFAAFEVRELLSLDLFLIKDLFIVLVYVLELDVDVAEALLGALWINYLGFNS